MRLLPAPHPATANWRSIFVRRICRSLDITEPGYRNHVDTWDLLVDSTVSVGFPTRMFRRAICTNGRTFPVPAFHAFPFSASASIYFSMASRITQATETFFPSAIT